ncbi:hypothetical protein GXB85_13420 [Cellulomonas sp. APG4]|uniref:hypothetical protein n=1 Tax=Cellulomonas sp. APG4 TaxID=1538656 RepID=UPI00137A6318|nr:hypothetical protein [Cellulomonas sp. APG4]NCT91942.1 hypothetical protein [Cellulomonas sp. APG4]
MRRIAGQRPYGGDDGPSAAELLLEETRRAEDLQEGAGTALDQVAGITTGFAGVVVSVLAGGDGWPTLIAAVLAALSAVCGVRAMAIRTTATLRPVALLERFEGTPRAEAEVAVLATAALLHEDRAERLRKKRWWFSTAGGLLVGAIAVLLLTLTLDAVNADHEATAPTEQIGPTPDEEVDG